MGQLDQRFFFDRAVMSETLSWRYIFAWLTAGAVFVIVACPIQPDAQHKLDVSPYLGLVCTYGIVGWIAGKFCAWRYFARAGRSTIEQDFFIATISTIGAFSLLLIVFHLAAPHFPQAFAWMPKFRATWIEYVGLIIFPFIACTGVAGKISRGR